MSRIEQFNEVLAIIRRQVDDSGRMRRLASVARTSSREASAASSPERHVDVQELEHRVLGRIRKIPLDDENYMQRAGRLFIDSVLAWQFGEGILDDSSYNDVAQDMLKVILGHDQTCKALKILFSGTGK